MEVMVVHNHYFCIYYYFGTIYCGNKMAVRRAVVVAQLVERFESSHWRNYFHHQLY